MPRISDEKPNIKIFRKEIPIQILFLGMFSSDNKRWCCLISSLSLGFLFFHWIIRFLADIWQFWKQSCIQQPLFPSKKANKETDTWLSSVASEWGSRYTFILAQRDKILAKDISEDRHWLYLGESLANRVTGWAFQYRDNPLHIGWHRSLLQKFSAATPSAAAASVMCQNTFSKDKRADPVSWPDSSTSN